MTFRILAIAAALLLAGCGETAPPATASTRPVPLPTTGLERVIGQTAKTLTSLFGRADQDVREANGRKLQFGNGDICVLDTYLYARRSGQEPVVTWVDARRPDGGDTDRVRCVDALARK